MTTDRIERRLPEILTELSVPQVPDYLDDILSQTARIRPRPGWTLPERWLPMDIALRPVSVGRLPLRTLAVLALLLLGLAVAAFAYLGAQRPKPAPLYGPAANGSLVYERNGDIFIAAAGRGDETLVIGGDTTDISPRWSLDGSTIWFGRVIDGETLVMAADPDGSDVREVSRALAHTTEAVELSPDARHLVAINVVETPARLEVLSLSPDNSKTVLDLDTVVPTSYAQWRPPNGGEIVFLGHPGGVATELGLYAIRPDGSGLRQIAIQHGETPVGVATQLSFLNIVMSDDGRTAAYWNWETQVVAGRTTFVHLIDLDTGVDHRMTYDPTGSGESQPAFLADGRLIMERGEADGYLRLLVAPPDASAPGTFVGDFGFHKSEGEWALSPDREEVLFDWAPLGGSALITIASGVVQDTDLELPNLGSWQRLAP
jgi:hypothetical protein